MFYQKFSILLFGILFLIMPNLILGQENPKSFSFTLNNQAKTSAGIYENDGTLIRTLWSGVKYNAGTYTINWDGMDDFGNTVPNGIRYSAKVLSNNVNYIWEGVIGNTSDSATGASKYHSFDIISCMAIAGNIAYCGAGYNEGSTSDYKFSLKNPQQRNKILASSDNTDQSTFYTATDGARVYWAGYDPFSSNVSKQFIFATNVNDDNETLFSSGISLEMTYGRNYISVINYLNNPNAKTSGLAVQKSHNYLFVSHGNLNQLHVLNKNSGALIHILPITNPRGLTVDRNDNLWMISGISTLSKYKVNSDGTLSAAILTIKGIVSPLATAVSPDNSTIVVADGGPSQQLKAYSNGAGSSCWVYGKAGGYSIDPTVGNDKFYFSDLTNDIRNPFICFQADGSFWLSDPGNYRVQHFSAGRNYIDRIMYLPHHYSVYVDHNNPTRLFCQYLEFKIDYSKPLAPNNGSWVLVKNWRGSITPAYYGPGLRNILNSVTTLKNGRTYAILNNLVTNKPELVELPPQGPLRFTGIDLAGSITSANSAQGIYPDGSLRSFLGNTVGGTLAWSKQALSGFNSVNNPIWNPATTLAATSATTDKDPIFGIVSRLPGEITSSDIIISFSGGAPPYGSSGYHLGGIKIGSNKWLWKTALPTNAGYGGVFPPDGYFDIGNGAQYTGSVAMAIERNVFWGYNGEFWKGSQTNKWNHVYDDGLFIGQFGVTGPEVQGKEGPAMMAGNAFSPSIVKVGNDYYLYHNDESYHGGVHRWKIMGLTTIKEQIIPLTTGSQQLYYASDGIDLMQGLPFASVLLNNAKGWTRHPKSEDYTNYDQYWSARTSVKTYGKRKSPDLWIKFANTKGPYSVNRDLGPYTNLSSWKLSGKINYEGLPNTDNISMYLDILDNLGKILVRFYTTITFGSPNIINIYANNTLIASGDAEKIQAVTNVFQSINISMKNGKIVAGYAGYSPVTIQPFDILGNILAPKTMRIYFDYKPKDPPYAKIIDLDSFRFSFSARAIKAYQIERGVQVNWTTEHDGNVVLYEIEKSSNNQQFEKAGLLFPKASDSLIDNFTWIDENPKEGDNYYRIKKADYSRIPEYSKIVNVLINAKSNFEVYPNPVTEDYTIIKLNNILKGTYTVKLLDNKGQTVFRKTIYHPGGSASQTIPIDPALPSATYNVQIIGNGIYLNKQLLKQ